MDAQRNITGQSSHLDGEHTLGNHFARANTYDSNSKNPLCLRIDEQLVAMDIARIRPPQRGLMTSGLIPNTGTRVSSPFATQRSWSSLSATTTARISNWLRWFDMKTYGRCGSSAASRCVSTRTP